MKITTEWNGPDQRYLIAVYPLHWTWDDFNVFKTELDAMMQSVSYEVGAIADLSQSGWLPPDASRNFSKAFTTAPANMGLVINVITNPFFVIVVNIIRRLAPHSPARYITLVKSLDEARTLMDERYPERDIASERRHG